MDFSAILKDFGVVGIFVILVVIVAKWGMTYIDSIRQDAKNEKTELMNFIKQQQELVNNSWKNIEELTVAIKQLSADIKQVKE
ncbi:MAG: hypothetical protein IKO48_07205 [Elusimicrobia bacterium]|nr:hypothetical protein [Elusimicrobiota bacterium]